MSEPSTDDVDLFLIVSKSIDGIDRKQLHENLTHGLVISLASGCLRNVSDGNSPKHSL